MSELSEAEKGIVEFIQSPLGQEIQEANNQAFIEREATRLQGELDAIIEKLPEPVKIIFQAYRKMSDMG